MTRQHFQALADALAATRPAQDLFTKVSPDGANSFYNGIEHQAAIEQWEREVHAIAGVCRSYSPRFDEERFVKACYA